MSENLGSRQPRKCATFRHRCSGRLHGKFDKTEARQIIARLRRYIRIFAAEFPGFVSEVDASETCRVGRMAVKYSGEGQTEGSVAMRRLPGASYSIDTFLTPLNTVAKETKHLDPSYIANGNDITEAYIQYLKPLVGEIPKTGSFDELK